MYNLEESTSTLVKKASHLYIRLANRLLKAHGVAHAYTPFLLQLWQEDGQIQSVLHKKIGIEQPTAVRTLNRMERDNFIKRIQNEDDKRETKIFLTKKSRALHEKLIECAHELNDIALINIPAASRKILNKLLRDIILNLEKELL